MDARRPRASFPARLPPELWVVIGLLCTAGLFTGIPVLRALPDAFKLLTDGGLWDSIGPLAVVLLLELGLFAAADFALALFLSRGDPVARVITIVVGASLAFGLLAGGSLDGVERTVTVLCSVAAVLCLTVPASVRAFFATRRSSGGAPPPVVAAEAVLVLLAGLMIAIGLACLPVAPVKAKFAVVGLALAGISVAALKVRGRLQTGDPAARTLASALMAAYVVGVLVLSEGTLTGALFVPLGVAVAVVALLWLPPDSQAFFGTGPALGLKAITRPDRPPRPERPAAPQPPPLPLPRPSAAPRPEASRSADDDAAAFTPRPLPPRTAPAAPPGRPLSSSPPPPPPPATARAAMPAAGATLAPVPPGRSAAPEPDPAPAAAIPVPPRWLLEAPPAGFWPAARPRAAPRKFEVVDLGQPSADDQVAPGLGIRFDTTSWFPALEGREQIRGAYLVSMVMFDDSGANVFRGTSTLLVTSARLVGVCPRGESADRPLDPGRVAVWTILLDQVDWVQAEGSADGGHLTLKGWDSDAPWALLTKPRVAVEGAFQPARLVDLADVVNRAKHSSA